MLFRSAAGVWEVSGNEVVPHIDRKCKWGIFANATDAAANTPFYMGPFDNVEQSLAGNSLEATNNILIFETVADMVASTSLSVGDHVRTLGYTSIGDGGDNAYDIVAAATGTDDGGEYIDLATHQALGLFPGGVYSVKQWGATGDGVTDDTTAINTCIVANYGKDVFFPAGTYIISDELLIGFSSGSSTRLFGANRNATKIALTGVSNKAAIRVAASNCTIEDLGVSGDAAQTGNSAIRVAPEDETQTDTRVGQSYNLIQNLDLSGTFDEGVTIKTGPDVGGPDSDAYHNIVRKIKFSGDINVGVRIADSNEAAGSPSNRNWIEQSYFSGNMNVGVWNEAGDTTWISDNSFEGVDHGTSPKASPTAIFIEDTAPTTGNSNLSVVLFNNRFENNTTDIDNNNVRTQILAGNHDRTKCNFAAEGGADPLFCLGGYDYSLSTMKMPGYKYQTNSQEAIPNSSPVFDNGVFLLSTETRLSRYREVDFSTDLYVADNSNSNAEGQTYNHRVGKGTLIGNRFTFEIKMSISSLGTLTTSEGAQIGGLPYLAKNTSNYQGGVTCVQASGLSITAGHSITGYIAANTDEIILRLWDATSGVSALLLSELSATGNITLTGSYEIESV